MATILVIAAATQLSQADDGPVKYKTVGGSEYVIGNNGLDVRLDSELVIITLNEDYYTVDATFWLFNEGADITTDIGFPEEFLFDFSNEEGWKDSKDGNSLIFDENKLRENQEYKDFQTWVNGKSVDYTLMKSLPIITSYRLDHFSDFQLSDEERKRLIGWLNDNRQKYDLITNAINLCERFIEQNCHRLFDSNQFTFNTTDGNSITYSFGYIMRNLFIPIQITKDTFEITGNDNISKYHIMESEYQRFRDWRNSKWDDFDKCCQHISHGDFYYTFNTGYGKTEKYSYDFILTLTLAELDWMIKKVTLPAESVTVTRVHYNTKYLSKDDSPYWRYIYGTGKDWKDNIKKAVFKIIENKKNFIDNDFQISSMREHVIKQIDSRNTEITILNFEPDDMECIEGDNYIVTDEE